MDEASSLTSPRTGLFLISPRLARGALVVYILCLLTLTHLPIASVPPMQTSDKLLHLLAYFAQGGFATLVLLTHFPISIFSVITLFMLSALFAGLDEWTQSFVGRYPDWRDWYADLIGLSLGITATLLIHGLDMLWRRKA
ncbi:MAG: VanZ family protein [Planctomycetaceae bacterium]|nr:VanZ family protein [Planctomycetaceae bacterium]